MKVLPMRDILRMLRKLMVVKAMIGMVALLGAYVTTGQIIPVFSNGH